MLIWPAKDPDEIVDYTWSPSLDGADTIATFAATLISGDVSIDSTSNTDTIGMVWLSGGTVDSQLRLVVTTAGGRTLEETIGLEIRASGSTFAARFKAIFPAFSAASQEAIDFWSAQALLVTSPIEACLGERFELATMLVTAHYLTEQGLGTGAESEMAAQGMGGFKRIKSGTIDLERADGSKTAGMGSWATTSYGVRVYPMLKACLTGPRVTGTGVVAGCGGFNGYAGPFPPYFGCG